MAHRSLGLSFMLFLLLLGGLLVLHQTRSRPVSAQTIPTRTPTPSGGAATATGVPGDPGPGPTPLPTSTSRSPQATATHTPFPIPPTPEDGFLPTAVPCALNPMIRALASGVNARSGPGLDYDVVGTLLLDEVRPIIGRAAEIPWWQTVLADGTMGWISDTVVSVTGFVGHVPIIDAPALEGNITVTPGTPWAPTPRPDCTPPPTETPTPSPTPSTTPTTTATVDLQQSEAATEESAAIQVTETTEATPTIAATMDATVTLTIPTAAPLPGEDVETRNGVPWMPIVGVGFILVAAGIFIVQRLRR